MVVEGVLYPPVAPRAVSAVRQGGAAVVIWEVSLAVPGGSPVEAFRADSPVAAAFPAGEAFLAGTAADANCCTLAVALPHFIEVAASFPDLPEHRAVGFLNPFF